MSDKILNNVWNQLTKDELTDSDFETWKSNIASNEEVQANVHEYLTDKELTSSDLNSWKSNLGLIEQDPEPKKEKGTTTGDAVVVSNQVEVSGNTDLVSEGTSLESSTNSDYDSKGRINYSVRGRMRKRELERIAQKNKDQALAAQQSIQNDIDNISNQEIVAAGANIYFGNLKQRNDKYSVKGSPAFLNAGPTVGFKNSFNSDEQYEDYLKETLGSKYDQYLNYQETGQIKPIDSNNEEQLQQIYDDVEIQLGQSIVRNSLFDVPEHVQEYMSFSTDFASGAETEEAQKFLLDEMRSNIDENKESYDKAYKVWTSEAVPLRQELTTLIKDIEGFEFNYIGASEDQVQKYNSLIEDYKAKLQAWEEKGFNELPSFVNSTAELVNEQQEGYSEMLRDTRKELISTEVYTEALLKDYRATSRVIQSFDEFFAQSFTSFADLISEVTLESAKFVGKYAPMSPLGFLALPENSNKVDSVISSIQKSNKNYNLEIASKRDKLPEAPTLDDVESGQVSIWDYIGVSLQDNSATLATTVVPGLSSLRGASLVNKARKTGVGLKNALQSQKKLWLGAKRTVQGTFFVGETGGKFADIQTDEAMREQELNLLRSQLRNTENIEDKTNIYNRIQELEEVEDYSLLQKGFTSFTAGATATYFESVGTLKLLEPAKNLAKKIGVNAAKKELYKSKSRFGFNVLGKTISGLKNLPKQVSTEVLEESLTLASHNILDIAVLDENKSVFEGMNKDFFANVAISSVGIMAPKTASNTVNIIKSEFRTKGEILKNQELAGRLIKLKEATTSENSKDLREEKREILNELGLSDAVSLHKLKYMSNDQILEVADLNRQMRELLKKSSQLGSQGDASSNETKDLKKKLEEEYTRLAVARQELLDSKERSNKKKAARIAKIMETASNNPDAAYWYGINDFYNDVAMTQMGDGDFVSIKGEIQEDGTIKYDNLDEQLAKYKDATAIDENGEEVNVLEYLKSNIEKGEFNATNIGKDIIVNQPVIDKAIHRAANRSAAHYAAIAPLEELFHLSVASQGIKFDESASNAVDEASKVLEQKKDLGRISEKDYNDLMKRISQYEGSKDFAEEFIASINNAIALGVISRSDIESMYSFRDFINNTKKKVFGSMGWILPIENANDVFNLVRNFKKDVDKGVIFQAPGEKEEIKKSLSQELEQKLEELEDSYYNGEIDEYQFEQAKDKLDKQITEAEKAVKVVDQEVETEVKPVQQVEKVDKIVKKATTEVFETKEVSDKNKQIAKTNDDIVKEMTDLGANRVSEIEDVEARKAIVDKLGENNIGAVTELAKKAAATSRDLPIDKNLKVGYEEFFLGFSEELSALINSYKANVDGKKVPFGAYMNQNLRLRYGSILNRSLKGKLKGSESLSSDKNIKKEVGSFVEESSSESTSRDEGRVLEQIDVRKFGPAKDKVEQISDIVNVEKGKRPTYKELTEEFIDPVSVELFNVPGKKIQGKATLTDAEAKSLQRLFVSPDNVRKLIKTMPPYNVAGSETTIGERAESIDVSKDTKGKSIGLSNKFMKQFYQPVTRAIPGVSSPKGRSLGATSQGQVYELKPEFRGRVSNEAVKQIQNSVGVTEAGVPNETISAANRTKYGTTLTGFAKTYIANVINVTGRSKQTDKQEQADTGAGKASIMLNKATDAFRAMTGREANIDFNDKDAVAKLKKDVFFILGDKNFGNFSEEDFIRYLLPLATKGYDYTFKTKDGKKVYVNNSKNTRNIIFQGRRDFFKSYNEYRISKGLEEIKWKPRVRTVTFLDSSGQKQTIKLATLKSQSALGVNSGKFFESLDDRVFTAFDQREGLKRIIVNLKKFADENPSDNTTVPMFLTMLNSNTNGLVRTAAIPKWIMYDENLKDSDYVYEHTQTASDTIVELMRAIYNSKSNSELLSMFDTIMANFDVAILPKSKDALVNKDFKQNARRKGGVSKKNYEVEIEYPSEGGLPIRYEDANKLRGAGIKLKPLSSFKFSKTQDNNLDRAFNDIIENKTGIASRKRYGIVEAITKGSSKGKFNFFIPPSAEDFVGLLYPTLGKGKIGDAQMSWYKKNLIDPFAEAMNKLSKARVYTTNSYNQLKKQLNVVPSDLKKKVGKTDYTKEQAVRVYIWRKQKMEIPGINKKDVNMLADYVAGNSKLQSFADQLINLQLGDGYAKPKVGWPAGTITTDILEGLNTTKRAKYLSKWQQNVDEIFSEDNLNKLQAAYGLNYRKALEGTLERMKTGRNRNFAGDTMTGRFTDWLTGSVGAIMFFNTRSAILQTISAANFINFEDNNIFAAAKAFANQKQYWSDFVKLINSDFLKERRGGLRMNVNEADIAEMAKQGGVRGVISKILELGFTPTQVADSFAIASGGSTFYRNRINTYKKQGLSDKEAEKKAFEDFREATEESQQSSRADRISQQQAGPLGRVILAFANAPAQYARIMKKAASDLKNGRGDAKANISRIIYYGAIQNLIFNALQQALFAVAFGDEEPEDEKQQEKYLSIANGMLDSILRGSGIGGSLVSIGKNTIIRIIRELKKDRPKLQSIALEVAKISPPVSAKLSRLTAAGKSYDWNKEEMIEKGLSLDNPAYLAAGNVVSALTNIPLDRVVKKANNVVQATTQDLQTWERIALIGGWQDWELGIKDRDKAQQKRSKRENKERDKRVRFKQRKIKIR